MSRRMPPYSVSLRANVREALALGQAGELVAAANPIGSQLRREWRVSRLELLYELAYLRIFVEWERFLEETFIRYLCGYHSAHGACVPLGGQVFGSLGLAQAAMLHGRPFALWHDPLRVVARSQRFFNNGFHEVVVGSNSVRLQHLSAVRHRIVHDQSDARLKFDNATMNFVGRRYRAARPGRFLRDWDPAVNPPRRWLETFSAELESLASQIA